MEIPLTQNQVALIDDADFLLVSSFNWQAKYDKGRWYACRRWGTTTNGKRPYIRMHVFLLGKKLGYEIDHIDGNGLNNCRNNLRHVTHSENMQNRSSKKLKGTVFSGNKWRARITLKGRLTYIGTFSTQQEAADAYDQAAIKYYGEYAWPNSKRG